MLIILKHIWRDILKAPRYQNKAVSAILILLAVIFVIFVIIISIDMGFDPHTCSVCGKTYFRKQEAINDKPACEICQEIYYVEHSKCLETKWEER